MKKEKILWIIVSKTNQIIIEFEVSKIFKWVVTKLMNKRKVKVEMIKKEKLRGRSYTEVYVDEFI